MTHATTATPPDPHAAEVNALVARWWPLALGLARKWGDRWPDLADDFESAATFALWRAARYAARNGLGLKAAEPERFAGLVRVNVRWDLMNVLKADRDRRRLHTTDELPVGPTGEPMELADVAVDRAAEPGHTVELADEVAALFARAGLTALQRAYVEGWLMGGRTLVALAAERGVGHEAVRQGIEGGLTKLRAVAGRVGGNRA